MFLIIIFLRQCLALGFLLALIGTAFKQKCRIRRILSASAVGSAVGCAALFLPGKIFYFLLAFWLTVKIAFGGNRKRQLYLSGCLAAAAVFYGGVWTALVGWLPFSSWLPGCLSAAAGIWLLYRLVWRDIKIFSIKWSSPGRERQSMFAVLLTPEIFYMNRLAVCRSPSWIRACCRNIIKDP